MRRDFLGDAFDFWKRAMLDVLRESSRGRCLKVLPMFTDGNWTRRKAARLSYAALLGVCDCDLLTTEKFTPGARAREEYFIKSFDGIEKRNTDVFLDPDKGIARKGDKEHVTAEEIAKCLSRDNVVAIYQHKFRIKGNWLLLKAKQVRWSLRTTVRKRVSIVGYEARQVGMLFATRSKGRAERLRCAFVRRFGVAVKKRLHYLP